MMRFDSQANVPSPESFANRDSKLSAPLFTTNANVPPSSLSSSVPGHDPPAKYPSHPVSLNTEFAFATNSGGKPLNDAFVTHKTPRHASLVATRHPSCKSVFRFAPSYTTVSLPCSTPETANAICDAKRNAMANDNLMNAIRRKALPTRACLASTERGGSRPTCLRTRSSAPRTNRSS